MDIFPIRLDTAEIIENEIYPDLRHWGRSGNADTRARAASGGRTDRPPPRRPAATGNR